MAVRQKITGAHCLTKGKLYSAEFSSHISDPSMNLDLLLKTAVGQMEHCAAMSTTRTAKLSCPDRFMASGSGSWFLVFWLRFSPTDVRRSRRRSSTVWRFRRVGDRLLYRRRFLLHDVDDASSVESLSDAIATTDRCPERFWPHWIVAFCFF